MIRSSAGLDQEARALLAQADAEYAPSRADRERVHARVLQSLAGLPSSPAGAAHDKFDQVADATRDAASGWVLGLGAKALVSVALGSICFGAGFFAGRESTSDDRPRAPAVTEPRPAPPANTTSLPLPSPLTPKAASIEPEHATPRASGRRPPHETHSARETEAPSSQLPQAAASVGSESEPLAIHTSALWQETQLLQRAQRALGSGNAPLARALLDELAHEFPNGLLLEERAAARILTECALGNVAEARLRASAFETDYPNSVHGERVRASCAGHPAEPHPDLGDATSPARPDP